ncbi:MULTISPECIES: palindromic element RPE1 domain-containing protein [unclassified Candidatus Tisiphia]|uniref:palindromic element RPE1 domain-containing protein n=1 Tax=unclassified Candidatus Tisiphia TaxID=2996318 RepID=UPI001E7184CD|nr:MAG: palindromic element RPE1 domain-containing protein [Rickettsia endosymbiont of Cimex lectularius]
MILSSINSSFTSSILHLIQKFNVIFIRPLSKLAYAEGFEGDAERRTAAYSDVREDSSTASTYKSPAEVEFRKRSIIKITSIFI